MVLLTESLFAGAVENVDAITTGFLCIIAEYQIRSVLKRFRMLEWRFEGLCWMTERVAVEEK